MAAHSFPRLLSHLSNTTRESRSTRSFELCPTPLSLSIPKSLKNSWLVGTPLTFPVRTSAPKSLLAPELPKFVAPAISLTLPTGKPNRILDGKVPRWSWRAIKSFSMGELEARKFRYRFTGTAAILMGILIEGTNLAAQYLRAHGITLIKVKEQCLELLGDGEEFYLSPVHPPLTKSAQRVLDWAVDERIKSGEDGEINTTDLLLGIWSEEGNPGQIILANLGFDDGKAKELRAMSSKPGFDKG